MTMVVGTDGVILIDSLETEEAARQALGDLRKVSDKPIKALIYTHSHPDHISGSRGLLDPSDGRAGTGSDLRPRAIGSRDAGQSESRLVPPLRLAYSFGFDLERGAEGLVEVGLGPLLRVGTTGFLPPTTVFQGSLDIEVAGITLHLREAPSESDDEIVLWFPDQGVLHVADVIQGECCRTCTPCAAPSAISGSGSARSTCCADMTHRRWSSDMAARSQDRMRSGNCCWPIGMRCNTSTTRPSG